MDLSRSILKNFANTVSPSEKSDKQMFARGTAKIIGEEKYVQLDGSEYLTPISELSDVQNDDRIFVTIENHTATVLGNFTYPIPRTAIAAQERAESSVKYTELESKVGEFNYVKTEVLEADYVKTNVLEAQYVKTEVLEADYVKTNVLEAQYVKTEVLEADYVKANVLEANYLSAEQITTNYLNATQIDAKYLSSEYIRANYLSAVEIEANYIKTNQLDAAVGNFGYLKTITVDANIASAVVANLADASIKSALIESLEAGKITNLEINTNKVNVHSDNGHSMWTDNTLLFKDSTRPRVQIGEDASKNYNFYIWDANGNLMFDALGLKEKGITSKIIKDDMIKDDASISAGKLNIKSLFETINNDGSNTIKSNKIYLDEQGQTLDVAFKSITTNPDGSSTIEGTNVDVSLGKISLSTWITKVDNALKKNNTTQTDYSNFEVKIGEISSTVSSHTGQITTVSQKADKIDWLVKSGNGSTDFTLTDRVASLLSTEFNINALTTFKNNASNGSATVINGGAIKTGTITADKIASGTITADKIAAGTITANKIAVGAVTADKIAAKAITADKLNVTSLESISAKIGGFNISGTELVADNNSAASIKFNFATRITPEEGNTNLGLLRIGATSGSQSPFYMRTYSGLNDYWFTIEMTDRGIVIGNESDPDNCFIITNSRFYRPGDRGSDFETIYISNTLGFDSLSDVGTNANPLGNCQIDYDKSLNFVSGNIHDNVTFYRIRAVTLSSSDSLIFGTKHDPAESVIIQSGYHKPIIFDLADSENGSGSYQALKIFYDNNVKQCVLQAQIIRDYTTSSGSQVRIDDWGTLSAYSSSSRRYKENISSELSTSVDPHGLYDLPVVEYVYKDGYLSENDLRYGQKFIGFIAEDVENVYPLAANYNSDGLVENWEPNIIIPGMLKLVQEQHTQIDYISRRMDTNDEKIEALQNQLAEAMITIAFQQKQIDILQAAS